MSATLVWLGNLWRRRPLQLVGTAAGTAAAIALLAALGVFLAWSEATLVQRVVAGMPVDWQVQLAPGADARAVVAAMQRSAHVDRWRPVGYADIAGLRHRTGATEQTTGAGIAVGIPADYARTFPGQTRLLAGSGNGPLLQQQTAANLHARPGDAVTIERNGMPPVTVRVAGVTDMPNADSFFQTVGGAARQAPPDNVVLLPMQTWRALFAPQRAPQRGGVHEQLHVKLARDLPPQPQAAYDDVAGQARNLEARTAGGAIVADNLGARLLGVRQDAAYARLLFLFLAVPGAVLAGLITIAIAGAGDERRRREQALLRLRGAPAWLVLRFETIEAAVVAIAATLLGLLGGSLAAGAVAPGTSLFDAQSLPWTIGSAALGALLAFGSLLVPAWRSAVGASVASQRVHAALDAPAPLWQRFYLDLILLAIGAIVFWRVASTGYQIVVAPEGVPSTSIHPEAFIAPLCWWFGGALLAARLFHITLQHGRAALAAGARALASELADLIAVWLQRRRDQLAWAAALAGLAIAFAVSTSVFNLTYNTQSLVDAQLTNGADVTVTGTLSAPAGSRLNALRALPSVAAAEPMMHRFAYVGNDLQDLFGVDPRAIGNATAMSDAYFANGSAAKTLGLLASTPDGVLVSEETVRDYQLNSGDRITLRLQSSRYGKYHPIAFRFIGVTREFPTAPKDSFLLANADYVAAQTGSASREVVLIRARGELNDVARRARSVVADMPGVKVTDLASAQRTIGSSLTAINARGLSALELGFAILLLCGATGLMLALSFAERRRTFAIFTALGATKRQLAAFVWSDTLFVVLAGAVAGLALGFLIAQTLVKVLTGVFDPPPEALAIPWLYLALLAAAAAAAVTVAATTAVNVMRRLSAADLREL